MDSNKWKLQSTVRVLMDTALTVSTTSTYALHKDSNTDEIAWSARSTMVGSMGGKPFFYTGKDHLFKKEPF